MKPAQSPRNCPIDHGTGTFETIVQGERSNSDRITSGSSPLKNGFPSRPSGAKSGAAFLRLDADIFLLIADDLEVRDIVALSQTCKVLSQKSMDHSLCYFDGLDDIVDGYKLLSTGVDSSTIALSLRSYKTYHLHAVLPQIGVQASQSPQLVLLNIVTGCSGLLDIKNGLGLFSQSTSDTGAIAQCQQSAVTTILQSEEGDPMLDYVPSAKIMNNFVIVVRRTAIEFYSVDTIQNALQSSQQTLNTNNKVFPLQSISYPVDQHILRATFLDTPLHWVGIPHCGPDSAYLGLDRDGDSARTMHVVYPNTTGGAACRFTLSPGQEILDIPNGMDSYSTTLCMWGETGRRMVHVGDFEELCLVGLSVPVGFGAERFAVPVEDRCAATWEIPYSRRDFARYLAFDEATGVCAVALASGRIWIADPARGTVFKEPDAPIKKIKSKTPPHPDPAWTSGRRKPWPGDVDHPSASRNVLLPRMSTKVHSWFPGKNDPDAFGSVTWFVNKALHIPGPATVVLFGTPRPKYRPRDTFDVIELKGRLLSIERDDDMASYNIKLLEKGVVLEAVVAHLKGGGLLSDLPGQKVAVDGFILNAYGSWRQRWAKDTVGPLRMW
ncbi:hypothetical protein FRC00_004221 [Tulasnella sp. 408]|nr:hypothetical protein FRC00_004221 [Tulasnella sp. 408]